MNGLSETVTKTPAGPLKTNVSRFQATHGSETRGSNNASSSKVNVSKSGSGSTKTGVPSTRTAVSPTSQKTFGDNLSMKSSMRSTSPYSQGSSYSSKILATASWSEAAEEELVSNIGARERTRQEVLWEIVASEERYDFLYCYSVSFFFILGPDILVIACIDTLSN